MSTQASCIAPAALLRAAVLFTCVALFGCGSPDEGGPASGGSGGTGGRGGSGGTGGTGGTGATADPLCSAAPTYEDFAQPLGKVAYHVPCHLRVQAIGPKTRELLALVPGTTITAIERCSGHDGTYAVKREHREASMRIAKPVVERVKSLEADHFASDCPMAAAQIASGIPGLVPRHPLGLLRQAYGL